MLVIGHRGASAAEPENTPAAFAAADRMGADGVELDVRWARTPRRGSRLVVHHDPLPTGPDAAARIDGFPDLDDVLDACGDRMLVNVEIKNSDADGGADPTMAVVGPTIDALRRRGRGWRHRWLISSFSLATVDFCRAAAPEVPTAFLVEVADEHTIAVAAAHGHAAIHPWHVGLRADQVTAAHAAGLAVNIWTCNDAGRLRELADMGVDGACTDVPDTAIAVLGERPATPRWAVPGTRA